MSQDDEDEYDDEEEDADEEYDCETRPCPFCKKEIYEQAELCPHCGRYISDEDLPARHPPWVIVGAVIALVAMLLCCWFLVKF